MLNFPQTQSLTTIVRALPLNPKYIGESILPEADHYSETIEWDILGATGGMTLPHNLEADVKLIPYVPISHKSIATAYWKEASRINEKDLLYVRKLTNIYERAGIDLVTDRTVMLNGRLDTRKEWCRWQALLGTLTINENGVIRTIDYEIPGANKVGPPSTHWDNAAADILGDLKTWIQLFRGTGAGNPRVYMNKKAAGYVGANSAIRDLIKQSQYALQVGIDTAPKLLLNLVGGLSEIITYDEGYIDSNGTNWGPFIPDNKIILIANGPAGEKFGEFKTTPSLHIGGISSPKPGKFAFIEDKTNEKNPYVDICTGQYGLPVIYHPSWIVVADVTD